MLHDFGLRHWGAQVISDMVKISADATELGWMKIKLYSPTVNGTKENRTTKIIPRFTVFSSKLIFDDTATRQQYSNDFENW
jgi:hypothetical protein